MPEEQAAAAAAELAEFQTQVNGMVEALGSDIAYLRGRFDVLLWAIGINAAATIAILGVLLRH